MTIRRLLPRLSLLALLMIAGAIAACDRISPPADTPVAATATPTPTEVEPTEPMAATPEPITLRVWVPPQFSSDDDAPAGDLLAARLEAFSERYPRIRVEVRTKAEEGSGGLLSSLTAAHAAAPRALPDLIALPRSDLEAAAIKGLIHPVTGLVDDLDDPDWYPYARDLARLEEDQFGIPFAGDAVLLLYRPAVVETPPATWDDALDIGEPLAYPAASPEVHTPLALYLAAGGALADEEGRPTLDSGPLTRTLEFLQDAERTGLIPVWLTQYETQDLALQAYQENRAHMAVSWASDYLREDQLDAAPAHLPTPDGAPLTLADGWVWALASPDEERLEPAFLLADFLTDSEFMGTWTEQAGYFPTRAEALGAWADSPFRTLISRMIASARVQPPADVTTAIAPSLLDATLQVLKGQSEPAEAAQIAVESLQGP